MTFATPASVEHVGDVPAAAALDVVGVHDASVDDGQGVRHGEVLVEPVGVDGDLDVVFRGDPERACRGTAGAHRGPRAP